MNTQTRPPSLFPPSWKLTTRHPHDRDILVNWDQCQSLDGTWFRTSMRHEREDCRYVFNSSRLASLLSRADCTTSMNCPTCGNNCVLTSLRPKSKQWEAVFSHSIT